MTKTYDTLVLGAGSAGYGAALYAARYKLDVAVIGLEPGGLLNEAHLVENYPGYVSIGGKELMDKFKENLDHLQVPIFTEYITEIKKSGKVFEVVTDGKAYKAKTLIIALGTEWRKLNVPGEKEFSGRGVSYCFTCDAYFYKNKDAVAIIGGGDSAAMASLLLADYAKKVYILYRGEKLRAEPIYHDKIKAKKNIEIVYKVNVTEIVGSKVVEKVKLDTGKELNVNGVFVTIGQMPKSELVKSIGIDLDEKGYIKKDEYGQTNVPGVFVAGDIAVTPLRQVIVGAGEGAIAAQSAYNFLNNMPHGGH